MNIQAATDLSNQILQKLGLREVEAKLITQNLIEAELVEKKTHGLIRLPAIASNIQAGKIKVSSEEIEVISEHPASLHFDAKYKPGFYVIYKSLEVAFKKVKQSGLLAVGIKDLTYASGYIGDYARLATEQNLIFMGFHNSPGGLVPFGTTKSLWGTNPITIGIPTHGAPVILDMASSQFTWGDLMLAKTEGRQIKAGVAIDSQGNLTTDPVSAMTGGILPIAGHKGSGLAFMVELLAGAVTNSRVGGVVQGGWGSFYLLIDPTMFRDLVDFKNDVQQAITELKSAPKAPGVAEVYFSGEQSHNNRRKNLAAGEIKISHKLMAELTALL
jgi:LDH2 family malate/lactate/ureidoglycolate dehydrogenase